MTLENVYFVSQIVSAVTVVISVLYLAAQIRANNKTLRSQGHYNALVLSQRPFEMIIENDGLARSINIGRSDSTELDADQWLRASSYIFMQINSWEYLYYQSREKALTEQLWSGANTWFSSQAKENAGWARFWAESGEAFDEPFASHVRLQMASAGDEQ